MPAAPGAFRRIAAVPPDEACCLELWTPGRTVGAGEDRRFTDGRWHPCGGEVLFVNKAGRKLCNDCVVWAEKASRGIPGGALRRADSLGLVPISAMVPAVFRDKARQVAKEQGVSLADLIRASVVETIRRHAHPHTHV
tara:strand:- start:128 stop:541 length:414 start_codon:yes stop_codon:yes gene_type:complete